MNNDQPPGPLPRLAANRPIVKFGRLVARSLLVLMTATTLVSLLARGNWVADLLANLRVQQVLGLAVALLMVVALRQWLGTAVVIFLLAIHLPWFAQPALDDQSGGDRMTVTVANVLTRNQRHPQVIADLVRRDPDLVVVIELSHALAMLIDRQLRHRYPHSIERPQDGGNFGIGLYSKYPLRNDDVFVLQYDIESIAATVTVDQHEYRVIATHPHPPIGRRGFEARNEHLSKLATRIARYQAEKPDIPIILVGDLNLTPWSPLFGDFERNSGLVRARDGFDMTPTWYRYPAFPFGLVLDHGLISDHLRCGMHEVGPDIGSDHRSITMVLHQR